MATTLFDRGQIRGFTENIRVQTEGLTAKAAVAAMVVAASAARTRVLNGTPKPSGYRQVVDGIEGAPLTAVRPDGAIMFAWQYLGFVVADTYLALLRRSPILTGAYVEGIEIYADGVQLAPSPDAISAAIGADVKQVMIVATVPYARRLEVGKREDGSPFVLQVNPHIVEETTTVARRLYGILASFEFNFVDLTNSHVLVAHGRQRRKWINGAWYYQPKLRPEGETVQHPAILITPRTA